MLIRAVLAVVVGLCLLGTPLAAQPPPGKTARIGLLGDVPSFLSDAFRQGLRELGHVEGQNIMIAHLSPDWRY